MTVAVADDFYRLVRQVYLGIRDGDLDPEAVFDLACLLLEEDRQAVSAALGEEPARGEPVFGGMVEEQPIRRAPSAVAVTLSKKNPPPGRRTRTIRRGLPASPRHDR